jgi:hypothetical protein
MIKLLKKIIRPYYRGMHYLLLRLLWCFCGEKLNDPYNIPIIINNFNRLTYLKLLIESLTTRGYNSIYIIDNASTYPPLLSYYKVCPYKVFRLSENIGYLSLWKTKIYKQFQKKYFVYTDSDLLIHRDCPNNFIEHFYAIMQRHKNAQKVGFGLAIDDLPDSYNSKREVIAWEQQFWQNEVEKGVFFAAIDTTFALYRPFVKGPANFLVETFRTGYPYVMHHLPWYVNSTSLSEEDVYYIKNIETPTHWSKKNDISHCVRNEK